MGDAVETVNRELFDRMQAATEYKGMGTTVAGILFFPQECLCFNVGDSSVFRVQGEYLAKLSVDDVSYAVRPGALTQALGGAPDYLAVVPACARGKGPQRPKLPDLLGRSHRHGLA